MRKLLLALAALPGIALAAPTYVPFRPDGGLAENTVIYAGKSTLDGLTAEEWGAAIDAKINSTSGKSIDQTLQTPSITGGSASGTDISGADLSADMTGAQAVAAITALQSAQTNLVTNDDLTSTLTSYLLSSDAKKTYAPLASPTFTGTVTGTDLTLTGAASVKSLTGDISSANLSADMTGAQAVDAINSKVASSYGSASNIALTGGTENTIPKAGDNGTSIANTFYVDRAVSNALSSVTANLANKVDVANGSAKDIVLTRGTELVESTDTPGAAGTAIPNTLWVDSYYTPKSWFIISNTTWTVCASGCKYTSPLAAWADAVSANYANGAVLTISISDGTYNIANQFYTETPNTRHVQIIGDTADKSKVVLNFTNGKGTNYGGFEAYNGGAIGLIDGVTIQQPSDGTGALASTDSSGRHIWNPNSYGGGVLAYGAGSNIKVGTHVGINWFYYSMVADNNGGIDAPGGGVIGQNAGDVNFMARGGAVIVCTPCTAIGASDYTDSSNALGSNFDAERNGSLYIDGSTGKGGLVNGIVGITGGAIWAHNTTLTGGLNSGGSAISLWEGAHGEFAGCAVSGGYADGVSVASASFANINSCSITGNTIGVLADGGRVEGGSVTITDNTSYGIQALHQGSVVMYSTYAKMSGNGTNFSVQSAGTESTSGSTYSASSIDVQ